MCHRRRLAFTIVEILVVTAVLGILAALVLTATGRARQSAGTTSCISNLRQLHAAFALYAADHDNYLPPYQNQLGVTHYGGDIGKPIPENGDLLVQSLSPYTRSKDIWFCPTDRFARTDSTVGNIRHAYTSYRTLPPMGYWTINGMPTTTEGPFSLQHVPPSDLPLLKDNLWDASGRDPQVPDYSHGGMFNYLYYDGHIKTYTYSATGNMW